MLATDEYCTILPNNNNLYFIFNSYNRSDIMQACWHKDSFNRPSFSDIVCQMQKLEEFPQTETEVGII